LIDRRFAVGDSAVHRHLLARSNAHEVADPHFFERHIDFYGRRARSAPTWPEAQ
jgi:hypothetical protein